eukprot:gnl/TRDRNA2_/TRDRNA2_150991_c2_seq2.p1 gnl/TRDRNA2_/TRDRNA2_150991_c2~~gnl/TRDRNA2_/TRDRNA2_150991_c2_seq2.p1  ORF type:complete len:319 (-),score=56.49 gnl/TRDRNA2_/TRDRNA2_150991_c2_seq2:86-1042(-)
MSVAEFVQSLAGKREPASSAERPPRYMFDFEHDLYCPELITRMTIPGHMFTTSVHNWQGDWEDCSLPPHFGVFISEKGFTTSLHVDSGNCAFFASTCSGRKRWRVVTSAEFVEHSAEFEHDGGMEIEDQMVFASPNLPFDTWGPEGSGGLMDTNVQVFEGIAGPGDLLYIPPGALHAAESIDDVLMFATNDHSYASLMDMLRACDHFRDFGTLIPTPKWVGKHCKEMMSMYSKDEKATMLQNKRLYGRKVERRDTPFLEAFRCDPLEKYCKEVEEIYNRSGGFSIVGRKVDPVFLRKWCHDKFSIPQVHEESGKTEEL